LESLSNAHIFEKHCMAIASNIALPPFQYGGGGRERAHLFDMFFSFSSIALCKICYL